MMNKDFHMKEAAKFQGEGDCYIHIEMKDGKRCERICAGDILGMIHGTCGIIDNLAKYTDRTFYEVLKDIKDYKKMLDITKKDKGVFEDGNNNN